jgi:hypothetical protein
MEMLAARVQQLETAQRNLKRWMLVLLSACALVPLLGLTSASDTTVDTRRLIVRDAQGRMRGELTVQGGPQLRLFDVAGESVAELAAADSGPILKLGLHGKSGGQIEATIAAGEPAIRLYDRDGKLAMNFVGQRGQPLIKIIDARNYSAAIGSTELRNANTGKISKRSAASIVLAGEDREVIWSAGK